MAKRKGENSYVTWKYVTSIMILVAGTSSQLSRDNIPKWLITRVPRSLHYLGTENFRDCGHN